MIEKDEHFQQDILCKPNEQGYEENNSTRSFSPSEYCANTLGVATTAMRRKQRAVKNPIANLPEYDGGAIDGVTLEIFSLRRRNAELTAKNSELNKKVTKALECLWSMNRFLTLWIEEGEGESWDDIHNHMNRLKSTIGFLEDNTVREVPALEIPKRWHRKG